MGTVPQFCFSRRKPGPTNEGHEGRVRHQDTFSPARGKQQRRRGALPTRAPRSSKIQMLSDTAEGEGCHRVPTKNRDLPQKRARGNQVSTGTLTPHPHSHLLLAHALLKSNHLRILRKRSEEAKREPSARWEASRSARTRKPHLHGHTAHALPSRVLLKTIARMPCQTNKETKSIKKKGGGRGCPRKRGRRKPSH